MKKVLFFILLIVTVVFYCLNKAKITFMDEAYKLEHSQAMSNCRLNQYFMDGKKREKAEKFIDVLACPQTVSLDDYVKKMKNDFYYNDADNSHLDFTSEKISDNEYIMNFYVNKQKFYEIPMRSPIVKKYVSGTYVVVTASPNKNEMKSFSIEKRYYYDKYNSLDELNSQIEKDKTEINSALKNVRMPRIKQQDFHRKIRYY